MTKGILWMLIIIIVIVGAWFWWSGTQNAPTAPAPAAAGAVGSANQSGFGEPNTTGQPSTANLSNATPQLVPGSDAAPIVGSNLMLGTDQNNVLGTYLIGYTGMTLYTYEHDTGASSTCYYQCAQTWPPYIVSPSDHGNFQYGVNPLKVSIITRADGTLQVTYDGHPLYFYSGDTTGNSTNGQGFGGVWYVIKP